MKKSICVILAILLICSALYGCNANKQQKNSSETTTLNNAPLNSSTTEDNNATELQPEAEETLSVLPNGNIEFLAYVTDITGDTVTVAPYDSFLTQYNQITFSKANLTDLGDINGAGVYITFGGEVMETSPPQINAISWRKSAAEPQYDNSKYLTVSGHGEESDYTATLCADFDSIIHGYLTSPQETGEAVEPDYTITANYVNNETKTYDVSFAEKHIYFNNKYYLLSDKNAEQLLEIIKPSGCIGKPGTESSLDWTTDDTVYRIYAIYPDCFTLEPVIPSAMLIKVNGNLPDEYKLNDTVSLSFDTLYRNENDGSMEGTYTEIRHNSIELDPMVAYKPVIYLYPEKQTNINVQLKLDGELTQSYPEYKNGWTVTADKNGTLTDKNGSYKYLFWEAKLNTSYDMSKGFCVKGSDTEEFLKDKLMYMGLNESEIADFTEFWLPHMYSNSYNLISFQTDCYTAKAQLCITPQPDTMIRIFMVYRPLESYTYIAPQSLTPTVRQGYTAVEWGGQQLDSIK